VYGLVYHTNQACPGRQAGKRDSRMLDGAVRYTSVYHTLHVLKTHHSLLVGFSNIELKATEAWEEVKVNATCTRGPPEALKDRCSHIHPVSRIHQPRHPTSQLSQVTDLEETLTAEQCSSDTMLSPLSRLQPDELSRSSLALPVLLFLASLVANISTPTKNSLLTSALAWLAVCASCSSKTNVRILLDTNPARKTAWAAGSLFALAQVCDKAVDGRAIWWAKVI
jgi:hypothetical protein